MLKDETPLLDTYEGRQLSRVVLSFLAIGLVVFAGIMLVRSLGGEDLADLEGVEYDTIREPTIATSAPDTRGHEAALLLADARSLVEQGNIELALRKLDALVQGYADTSAGRAAQNALELEKRGRPIVIEDPEEVSSEPDPVSVPEPPREEVVTTPSPSRIVFPPGTLPF